MTYIMHTMRDKLDPKEITAAYDHYNESLESLRDKFPSAAFAFATASWHYNPHDPRCPHDAWLEHLNIKEVNPDQQDVQERVVDIDVRLLGAYHDGYIQLVYKSVWTYTFTKHVQKWRNEWVNQGHGDWLIDEIRLSKQGLVLHEVMFEGAYWLIECEDVEYTWVPFEQSEVD